MSYSFQYWRRTRSEEDVSMRGIIDLSHVKINIEDVNELHEFIKEHAPTIKHLIIGKNGTNETRYKVCYLSKPTDDIVLMPWIAKTILEHVLCYCIGSNLTNLKLETFQLDFSLGFTKNCENLICEKIIPITSQIIIGDVGITTLQALRMLDAVLHANVHTFGLINAHLDVMFFEGMYNEFTHILSNYALKHLILDDVKIVGAQFSDQFLPYHHTLTSFSFNNPSQPISLNQLKELMNATRLKALFLQRAIYTPCLNGLTLEPTPSQIELFVASPFAKEYRLCTVLHILKRLKNASKIHIDVGKDPQECKKCDLVANARELASVVSKMERLTHFNFPFCCDRFYTIQTTARTWIHTGSIMDDDKDDDDQIYIEPQAKRQHVDSTEAETEATQSIVVPKPTDDGSQAACSMYAPQMWGFRKKISHDPFDPSSCDFNINFDNAIYASYSCDPARSSNTC